VLFHAFEPGSGRYVSDYPRKKWIQYVRAFIKQAVQEETERSAWIALLIALEKHALYERQGAVWDDAKGSWIANAIDEHLRRNFKGILNDVVVPGEPNVMAIGVAMHTNQNWKMPSSLSVPRRAPDIVQCVGGLLDMSTTLVLIDRNFVPSDGRFLKVLVAFADYLLASNHQPKITQIKYVTSHEKDRNLFNTTQQFESACKQFLPSALPQGIEVKFLLKVKQTLHKRLVMTERGSVLVEHGLDEGDGKVVLARLSEDVFSEEWASWKTPALHTFSIAGLRV
jgi:hypothetical protein